MGLQLKKDSEELLREVLTKNRPELLEVVDSPPSSKVSHLIINELRQAVTDEFIETGLNEMDEPNNRGLRLEYLIDELGRLLS